MRIDAKRGRVAGTRTAARRSLVQPNAVLAEGLSTTLKQLGQGADERELKSDRVLLAQRTTDFREKLAAIADEEEAGFDGSADGYTTQLEARFDEQYDADISDLNARIQPSAQIAFEQIRSQYLINGQAYQRRSQEAFTIRGVKGVLDAEAKSVGLDASMIDLANDNIEVAIAAAPETLQADLRLEARSNLGLSALSWYQENDPELGLKLLNEGTLSDYLSAKQTAGARASLNNQVERQAAQRQRQQALAVRQNQALLSQEISDIQNILSAGLPVSEDRYERVQQLAGAVGPEVEQNIAASMRTARAADTMTKLPLGEAIVAAQKLRQDLQARKDVSADDAVLMRSVDSALAGMKKRLASDPLSFAMDHRGGIAEINPQDPLTSMKARLAQAREAADYYGVEVRYFTNAELDVLQADYNKSPEVQMQFIDALASLGDSAPLQEIAPKLPNMAHLVGLTMMSGDRGFVRDALQAAQLRSQRALPSTTKKVQADNVAGDYIGAAFMLRPDIRAQAIASAQSVYDLQSARTSRGPDDFSEQDYKAILQSSLGGVVNGNSAFGGIVEIKNRAVWVPPDMRPQDFKRAWRKMPDAVFLEGLGGKKAYNADGEELSMKLLRQGRPVATTAGEYRIDIGFGDGPEWPVGDDGQPLTLNIDRIRPFLER